MKWQVRASQNLVAFLRQQVGDHSGKFFRRVLEANYCRVNGKVERFGSRTVISGDAVELAPNWKSLKIEEKPKFELVFEDEYFQVVIKPINWVCSSHQALITFGPKNYLVHRLDKDTSGLLIIAKSQDSRDRLMELFEKREVKKQYLALVDGILKNEEGIKKSCFGKKGSFQGQTIWGSCPSGLCAITRWKVIAKGKLASFLRVEPETGRTHQIRVHLSEMGHPILVDRQYAQSFRSPLFCQRPLLHAYRLQFKHPFTNEEIDLKAPLPLDICEALRGVGIVVSQLGEFLRKEEHSECRNESHDHKDTKEVK